MCFPGVLACYRRTQALVSMAYTSKNADLPRVFANDTPAAVLGPSIASSSGLFLGSGGSGGGGMIGRIPGAKHGPSNMLRAVRLIRHATSLSIR